MGDVEIMGGSTSGGSVVVVVVGGALVVGASVVNVGSETKVVDVVSTLLDVQPARTTDMHTQANRMLLIEMSLVAIVF